MNRLFKAGFAGAVFMALAVTAMASGPDWDEDGDAGDLPPGQGTFGLGRLGFISGNMGMSSLFGDIDVVDMYLINIVDPMNFRATTDPNDDIGKGMAFAQFDTQLWLFQPNPKNAREALGIVGNDDHFELGGQFSLLLPDATDGGPGLMAAGFYLLAITRFNHDPFSMGGDIFFQADPQEISSADGPGGMLPIGPRFTGWAGDPGGAFAGDYRIALRGVEFSDVPAPGALSLFIIAAVGSRRRRRSLLR